MRIYKKFFAICCGIVLLTTRSEASPFIVAKAGQYVQSCDFKFCNASACEFQNVPIHPLYISAAIFYLTYLASVNLQQIAPTWTIAGHALLCWDFEDNKVNFDNLRKIFHPRDDDGPIKCYLVDTQDIFEIWQEILTTPGATDMKLYAPNAPLFYLTKPVYTAFGETLQNSCQTVMAVGWCPSGGTSDPTIKDLDTNTFTSFYTIADCFHKDFSYSDETGVFQYTDTTNKCYYSGLID